MKYIKLFENFKNDSELEKQLDKYIRNNGRIKSYTINEDGTIDVDGTVSIVLQNLTKIPIRFGKVTGDFYVCQNKLKSLEGSPYYVGGSFYSSNNELTSLEGMPLEIGGDFTCKESNLKELDSLSNIEGDIYCDKNVDISKFGGYCKNIIQE